jgi:hypothetical protein
MTAASTDQRTSEWRAAFKSAAFYFFVSRSIVFGVWIAIASLNVLTPADTGTFSDSTIVIDREATGRNLARLATFNDGGWYAGIAAHGYEQRPFDATQQANWAFFPLHPLMWRAAAVIISDQSSAGFLIANLCFFLALVVLHRLVRELGYEADMADRTLMFIAFCPTSYFFSLPWSESLFLALTTSTFLAALKERWGLMFLLGALACACRFSGLFLVPSLLLWLWPRRHEVAWRSWVAVAAMPVGLGAFMLALWQACGNAFAFIDIQQAWGRHFTIPYKAFGVVIAKPYYIASDWILRPLNFAAFAGGAFAVYWLIRRRADYALAMFLGLGLLAPAMTGSLTSMARYTFGLFPVAIVAAVALNSPKRERAFLAISVALLAMLALAFQGAFAFAGA